MRSIQEIPIEEKTYNQLLLEACHKINQYVLDLENGNSMLVINTSALYSKIAIKMISPYEEVIKAVTMIDFNKEFPITDNPIISRILSWVEERLSIYGNDVMSSTGRVMMPFFEMSLNGMVSKRGMQYLSYVNELKIFLFEIRSYLNVKVEQTSFSEFLLSNKEIKIYTYDDMCDDYKEFQSKPYCESHLANEYIYLYCLQDVFESKENGIYITDFGNFYLLKFVNYIACCIDNGIARISGFYGSTVDYKKVINSKNNLSLADYMRFGQLYYIQFSICKYKYSYKRDCLARLKKHSPMDQFIKLELFASATPKQYKDYFIIKEIIENIANFDLENELKKIFIDQKIQYIPDKINTNKSGTLKKISEGSIRNRTSAASEKNNLVKVDDHVKKYFDEQLNNKISELRTEIYGLTESLGQDIINSNIQLNDRMDDIEDTYGSFIEDLENRCKDIEQRIDSISERITEYNELLREACDKKNEAALNIILDNKMNAVRYLIQSKCPDLADDNALIFQLALIVSDNAETIIENFLISVHNEDYKENYISKTGIKQFTMYTFNSNLGKCVLYKKDGEKHILELDMNEDLQIKEFHDFIVNCSKHLLSDIYYDNDIFTKLEDLLKNAKSSIYMIVPWVFEYPTFKHYAPYLKAAERRKVKIYLKYGYKSIGSNEQNNKVSLDNFEKTEKNVMMLKEQYVPSLEVKAADAHIKALIIDGNTVFIGSCNYLSFRHDYNKNPDFRHETMVLIQDAELANSLISYYNQT